MAEAEINVAKITGAVPTRSSVGETDLGSIVAVYDYRAENGQAKFQKQRFEPKSSGKTFRTSHWEDGKLKPGIDRRGGEKTRRLLYNLPALVAANLVFFCEGEKDCENVITANLFAGQGYSIAATTTADGAWGRGQNPKWHDSYAPYFTGKFVIIFADNDEPGRVYAEYAAAQIAKYAYNVNLVTFADMPEKSDVSDFLASHSVAELETRIVETPDWIPPARGPDMAARTAWNAEGMDTFLTSTEAEIEWLVPYVLASGCLTQIFVPRGIGKSVLANHWAVNVASTGKRVLILDRDNPRSALRTRLSALGGDQLGDLKLNLRVMSREQCPTLTKPDLWAEFPYEDYDLVIVDSLDAMAEARADIGASSTRR